MHTAGDAHAGQHKLAAVKRPVTVGANAATSAGAPIFGRNGRKRSVRLIDDATHRTLSKYRGTVHVGRFAATVHGEWTPWQARAEMPASV